MPQDQRKIYSDIELDLLENISKRLKMPRNSDLTDLDFTTQWQIEKLNDLRRVNLENRDIINSYGRKPLESAQNDVIQVVNNSLDNVDPIYLQAIDERMLQVPPLPRDTAPIQRITDIYFQTAADQDNLIRSAMLNSSQQVYLDTINQTTLEVITGINTPQVALSKTIRKWAETGLPLLQAQNGNIWTAEGYVNTVFRSMVRNATSDVQFERMNEYGVDLMEVSSHANARPGCAPFQGRIFSRSGRTSGYPALSSTTFGEPSGLFGINCRHDFYPFFPGQQRTFEPFNLKETEKNYELSQQQRRLERNIRAAKRQKQVYKANGDTKNYNKALQRQRNATKKLETFLDETGLTRQRNRESIFNIYS